MLAKLMLFLISLGTLSAAQQPSAAALDQLRHLEGNWQGTVQWIGSKSGPGPISASYYVTGNDSAVVENLVMQGKTVMTSVYHLDGADLRMTHYCAAKNQPRLKATKFDKSHGTIDFSFVDITNLDAAKPGHVEALKLQFVDADHLTLDFTFGGTGKQNIEHIELSRKP